jgi:hypothetical protein
VTRAPLGRLDGFRQALGVANRKILPPAIAVVNQAVGLRGLPGGERPARLVAEAIALEAREERVALGDTLPPGLRLVADDEAEAPSGAD